MVAAMATPGPISRRCFLSGVAAGSVAAGLAACGGSATQPPPAPSALVTAAPTAPPAHSATTPPTDPPLTPTPTTAPDALRRKAARILMVGLRGFTIDTDDPIRDALALGLGGVILFDQDKETITRNIQSPEQLAELIASLRELAPGNLIVAIDQEGGRVSRLKPAYGFPPTRSQAAIGATGDTDAAFDSGRDMAETMAALGIDLNLAPVVDVNINPQNPAIGAIERSFSSDPAVVTRMAEAEILGLHEFGIRSTIKHFPGLGSASANTDYDFADVSATWTEAEIQPFEALIALGLPDAVMVGHMVNDRFDPGVPASLSPATVDGLLRGQLGWDGAVITDDLGAEAIAARFSQEEAVALALGAGDDLLLFANQADFVADLAPTLIETVARLVESGRIPEARLDEAIDRLDLLSLGSAIE